MDVATLVMSLVLTQVLPTGKTFQEFLPVTVPVCVTTNGVRIEDSSCGLGNCLKQGRERAAIIWGRHPGSSFHIMCLADNGKAASEGSKAGGGHPALNFEGEDAINQ